MKVRAAALSLVLLQAGSARAQDPERFSLSMFHFNVQYVAGGLQGFPSGEDPNPDFDLDDAEVQDMIIVESFEPVLDLFLAHPGWNVTLEMQAYMVEVMMERHPGIVSKLKQLVDEGRAELVSFHWSDQLFLAYPRLDLERSHEILDAVYAEAGLTPSGVVFCQEGQFGVGMGPFARQQGRSILVLPKNLFRYQHLSGYDTASPLYDLNGVDVVIGSRSFSTPEVEVAWSFFDDGELLATGGQAPYVASDFKKDPAAIAAYEQELAEAEAGGFRIATITEYVEWAKAQGLRQDPLPPILDGTWQPPSTNSMRRWLGGSGLVDVGFACERDNEVLTGNVLARHWIQAAETLVAHAEREDLIETGLYADVLTGCWREVLLAQVTDATGINPFINEVRYGLEHGATALDCANAVIFQVAPEVGGPFLHIDTAAGTVAAIDDLPTDVAVAADAFFSEADGFEVVAPGRTVDVTWEDLGNDGRTHRVLIEVSRPADASRSLEVVFPLQLQGFYLTPGLVENDATFHPFADFELQEGRISLPVANGMVGLADEVWLIKQTSSVHIAATFEPGDGRVRFIDDTLDPEGTASWVFWILEGTEEQALQLADRLNLHPSAYVETGVTDERGCGCGASGSPSIACLAVLFVLVRKNRRQR